MVSPNLFLKLNISFNIIIGFLLIYYNLYISKYNFIMNILGVLFIYISINNIIILKKKKCAKLKKDILKTNTLLYCTLCLFILLNIKQNIKLNTNITLLILTLFAVILNFIGFKITKINIK